MTMNKWIFGLLCFLATVPAQANKPAVSSATAEKLPDYTSRVSNESIRQEGEKVVVSFNLDFGENIVRSQHKRIITPVISSHDGTREVILPSVIICGRNRALKELRKKQTDNEPADIYTMLHGNRKENSNINYQVSTPYQPWMEQSSLSLREEVIGCACGGLLSARQNLMEQLLYTPQIELSARQECPVEFVARHEQRDAFLIYPVNKAVLSPELYGNRRELQKIDSALSYVQRNPAYEIRHIAITGFASPEGNLQSNIKLSEARATALKSYIRQSYSFPDTLMTVTSGAENWEGLTEALKSSQLPYKDEILDVIAQVDNPDHREEVIRGIGGGVPYQTLLHTIYPGLRKNTFTISYISKERTPEEARQLVFSNPAELNVYEFYKVADTFYADNREMHDKVLTIAADTYPDHSIANNNAARIAIANGELEKAEQYLLHTRNEPFTWNNRACLLWKQGKRPEAILWWKKAAEQDNAEALQNLKELEKRGY